MKKYTLEVTKEDLEALRFAYSFLYRNLGDGGREYRLANRLGEMAARAEKSPVEEGSK